MSKFIIAEKLHMSQIFDPAGKVVPVTILKSAGVKVTQVKTLEKDSYNAVQVGAGRKKKINKAIAGHLKNLGNFLMSTSVNLKPEGFPMPKSRPRWRI